MGARIDDGETEDGRNQESDYSVRIVRYPSHASRRRLHPRRLPADSAELSSGQPLSVHAPSLSLYAPSLAYINNLVRVPLFEDGDGRNYSGHIHCNFHPSTHMHARIQSTMAYFP
jgi:hypothetical protein